MTNQLIIEDLTLVPVPVWWRSPWIWLAIVLVAVVLGVLLRRWWKTRPAPLVPPPPMPSGPPPHLEALRRLAELRAKHPRLSSYDVALEASDILRVYIEGRFGSPIRYQTTREFLGAAHTRPGWDAQQNQELGNFLNFFDRVKFAAESAAPKETGTAIDFAEAFVRRCIPPDSAA